MVIANPGYFRGSQKFFNFSETLCRTLFAARSLCATDSFLLLLNGVAIVGCEVQTAYESRYLFQKAARCLPSAWGLTIRLDPSGPLDMRLMMGRGRN